MTPFFSNRRVRAIIYFQYNAFYIFFSSPGEKQHPLMSHEHSLVIHDTMEKIRSQIGLVYKEDKIE